MPEKLDFLKEYKDLYLPPKKPVLVTVPAMPFIYCDGSGSPDGPVYQNSVSALYALTWTIKMSKMGGGAPAGYFEYKVPPLEGLWTDTPTLLPGDRDTWRFTSMIRQPDFVTPQVFAWALEQAARKKPDIDFSAVGYAVWEEGLCAQIMHIGPYSAEPETLALLTPFFEKEGYSLDFTDETSGLHRRHHEIYLGDPRKTKPENLRTVLRYPVR